MAGSRQQWNLAFRIGRRRGDVFMSVLWTTSGMDRVYSSLSEEDLLLEVKPGRPKQRGSQKRRIRTWGLRIVFPRRGDAIACLKTVRRLAWKGRGLTLGQRVKFNLW
jgi:hypothetical protein